VAPAVTEVNDEPEKKPDDQTPPVFFRQREHEEEA
jgi:hypothetical protein